LEVSHKDVVSGKAWEASSKNAVAEYMLYGPYAIFPLVIILPSTIFGWWMRPTEMRSPRWIPAWMPDGKR